MHVLNMPTRLQADCTQSPDEVFASIAVHFEALKH
jgi:hypothetical protein